MDHVVDEQCQRIERETDEDPGIIIYFADDANIHNCLGLASLATVNTTNYGYTISPPNQGLNPAQSRINFQTWLDGTITAMSSRNTLVIGVNNTGSQAYITNCLVMSLIKSLAYCHKLQCSGGMTVESITSRVAVCITYGKGDMGH